ncbi:aminodeoxychorismate synthase component I [Sphingomonas sp. NFR15]|uniref:aminodeoxychorismate synthase component I n=1 Tax=Sphingomonas sp. NFR15 TaxID=1566282 RepID=UPI00088A8835|nr:aminodeoxychorismate synthase component I [Sphingomonas sp. NFR15]SDA36555.1 para-aminobenzoate synthetase / 4-amino-4-deoxychorismate lyase [Sphingomonas sp. NFR15]
MPPRDAPFVLLDDYSEVRASAGRARLYRDPVRIVAAYDAAEVRPALEAVRAGRRAGLHAAGYLAYEAAAAFEPIAGAAPPTDAPLLWFGLFERWDEVADVAALLPDPDGAWIGAPEPDIAFADYAARFARVRELIVAGDIYQANLTYRARVPVLGDPRAAYAQLRARARGGFGALVHDGARWLLSLSPESFFALSGRELRCRPMKGTAPRGATRAEDDALAATLAADPKQRAENLMIVDLMRNDLARVAAAGSVAVPDLFAVERYPTVQQMVSTVAARLAEGRDAVDVLAALFPCGSITGAPKLRAMEVIGEVEDTRRDVYTGAIGRIDADGDAAFNVAIRTLTLPDGADTASFGVGGGIVADSRASDEWAETRTKSAFLATPGPGFDLIETMRFDPLTGVARLERHLARMRASAAAFGFVFDRHIARNELQAATFRLREPRRLRLLLARSGAIAIEVSPLPAPPAGPVPVAVVPLPVDPGDIRLRHKTTDRGFYDAARVAAGTFEVLFADPSGALTEGSFTALFVARGGVLVTPPLARGLLPGVLRAALIAEGKAIEGDLTAADLAGGFFIGNALRGLIPAVVTVAKPAKASL